MGRVNYQRFRQYEPRRWWKGVLIPTLFVGALILALLVPLAILLEDVVRLMLER